MKKKASATPEGRSPVTVFKQLCDELPNKEAEKMRLESTSWSPETFWMDMIEFIYNHVEQNDSPYSVRIYAILHGWTEDDMRDSM